MEDADGPMGQRGASVVTVIGEVMRTAVGRTDVVDVFMLLSDRAVDLLPVAAAGVLVRDGGDLLHVVGSSGVSAPTLELLRAHTDDLLRAEVLRTGRAASVALGDAVEDALRIADAFPMVAGREVVGMLGTFGPGPLRTEDRVLAQALADLAALALLRTDIDRDGVVLVRRVHEALQARATLAQAVGVIAARFALDPDAALRRLRAAASRTEVGLIELATTVVARDGALPGMLDPAADDPAGRTGEVAAEER